MKLNVSERLTLLDVLQAHMGNFLTLGITNELTAILAMTDKEFKRFNIKQVGPHVTWNAEGSKEREIEIGEKATEIIVGELTKLNDGKRLERKHYTLYEKFVGK